MEEVKFLQHLNDDGLEIYETENGKWRIQQMKRVTKTGKTELIYRIYDVRNDKWFGRNYATIEKAKVAVQRKDSLLDRNAEKARIRRENETLTPEQKAFRIESQREASKRWRKKKETVLVYLDEGTRDEIAKYSDNTSGFIKSAIEDRLAVFRRSTENIQQKLEEQNKNE